MTIVPVRYKFETDLEIIDPDCSYEDWIRVGRAIYDATDGSNEGLKIFWCWSSQGKKYKDKKKIAAVWSSFRTGEKDPHPFGTLVMMAAETMGLDPDDYLQLEQTSMIRHFSPSNPFFIPGRFKESE